MDGKSEGSSDSLLEWFTDAVVIIWTVLSMKKLKDTDEFSRLLTPSLLKIENLIYFACLEYGF